MKKESFSTFLALFTSLSTIFCCALPIILVVFGMGAVFAALTANFPFLVVLAENAGKIFILAAILLIFSGYFIFVKAQECPADKKLAEICVKTRKINKIIWIISALILVLSGFFKYILILFL